MGRRYAHRLCGVIYHQLLERGTFTIRHSMVFCLPALSGREVYREQTPHGVFNRLCAKCEALVNECKACNKK